VLKAGIENFRFLQCASASQKTRAISRSALDFVARVGTRRRSLIRPWTCSVRTDEYTAGSAENERRIVAVMFVVLWILIAFPKIGLALV